VSKYHQSWAMRTPPEVLLKKEITKETDFYALGIITYELTTGQLPFNEKDIYSIHKKILKSEPLSFFKIISFHDEDDFLDDDVNNSEEDVKNWEDFIYSLICLNQKKRLGVKGFDKIKQHPFLNSINFHQLQTQEY
jgi:serine/threonine protein kinase